MNKREKRKKLKQIRDLVVSTYWIKSRYLGRSDKHPGEDCYCLVGMINKVCGVSPGHFGGEHMFGPLYGNRPSVQLGQTVWKSIKTLHPKTTARYIEDWNDQIIRTRRDVVKVLDHAIEHL